MSSDASLSRISKSLERIEQNTHDLAKSLQAIEQNFLWFCKMIKELEEGGDVDVFGGDPLQPRHETIL